MPTTTKTKATKSTKKAKVKDAAVQPASFSDLKIDVPNLKGTKQTIPAWAGLQKNGNDYVGELTTIEIDAYVVGDYAIFDLASDDTTKHLGNAGHWYEIYKKLTVNGEIIWNRVVSAILTFEDAARTLQLLLDGKSAIDLQVLIDKDWQVTLQGRKKDEYSTMIDVPKNHRSWLSLYSDRFRWHLKPQEEKSEQAVQDELGDW